MCEDRLQEHGSSGTCGSIKWMEQFYIKQGTTTWMVFDTDVQDLQAGGLPLTLFVYMLSFASFCWKWAGIHIIINNIHEE